LKKNRLLPRSFAQAVFHMPNGKFPRQVASGLGFTREQVRQSLVIDYLGNTYTASALLGLVSVLETARPGDLLFFVSYGSGAGSDAFIFRVTKNITDRRQMFQEKVKNKQYIDYATYLRYMNMI
jgi:hydroxymethylglutaryl-CoA synthase